MTRLAALAILGSIAALPAMAQTTWTGANRVLAGGSLGGCNLRLAQVTHSGGMLSNIFITLQNRGSRPVRVGGTAELRGTNQRKFGPFDPVTIAAGGQQQVQTFTPYGGSLAGSTFTVTITSCTPQ